MQIKEKESILKEKLISFVEKEGFKLFDFKLFYNAGIAVVRLLIDFEQGGISVDECSKMNKKLSSYLEKESLMDENFVLEVSSPGARRQLVDLQDFLRAKDQQVSLWLTESYEGRDQYEAKVIGVDFTNESVTLEIAGKQLQIPKRIIRKAKQKLLQ